MLLRCILVLTVAMSLVSCGSGDPGLIDCAAAANQLCVCDVSAEIDLVCEKAVECGWEEMTTMEICRDELQAVQMLYMCLKPEILDDYIACVRSITCGPDSEDDWYACGAKHIQNY